MASSLITQIRVLWKRRALERSSGWTVEQLRTHQRTRMAETLRFAREKSPFYARFHKGKEDRRLEDLPIITKSILMESIYDLFTDRAVRLADVDAYLKLDDPSGMFRGRYIALSTSGSTGRRGVFLFSTSEWIECLASISRPMKWAGVEPNPFRPLRSAMLASTTSWHYSARVGQSLATRLLPTLRLDAGEPAESMVRRLNEWQPVVLVAYPSVLRQLADEQMAGRLRIAPRHCATSAEVLTAETRRRVEGAWGVRVFETYGANSRADRGRVPRGPRTSFFEDGAVIENVDEKGKPVPPGGPCSVDDLPPPYAAPDPLRDQRYAADLERRMPLRTALPLFGRDRGASGGHPLVPGTRKPGTADRGASQRISPVTGDRSCGRLAGGARR